jgi:protein farnesyltransferase/geranylgeranyltransferase type-1 subunit alpha
MPPNEPSVSSKAQLPAWLAIEFLADAKSEEAEKEKKKEIGEEAAVVSFRDLF